MSRQGLISSSGRGVRPLKIRCAGVAGLWGGLVLCSPLFGQIHVEYVAHACFVVESPQGHRVVIDPYNSHRWLGYSFPEGLAADAVLVSHPHYDHDASYYFPRDVPVFQTPGRYSVGDVRLVGLEGKHADPYGEEFDQINTIWILETGGVRIAHLGDNGPLGKRNEEALRGVDLLMIPIDGQYHILNQGQIDEILQGVQPRIVVPMHYQIPALSSLPESLGPIDPWLEGRPGVRRLESHRLALREGSFASSMEIVVFQPSPAVAPWTPEFQQTLKHLALAQQLFEKSPSQAVAELRRAVSLSPQAIVTWWGLGRALGASGRTEEAARVLEQGLAAAGLDDWEFTLRARALLAELYEKLGRRELAALQYRLVLAQSYRRDLREQAERFLDGYP